MGEPQLQSLLFRFGLGRFSQSHARPSAVFVDELDAGGLQGSTNDIKRCASGLCSFFFQADGRSLSQRSRGPSCQSRRRRWSGKMRGGRRQTGATIKRRQSRLKRGSREAGFDQIDINAEVIVRARELFAMFDQLTQSAQSRRIALLREVSVNALLQSLSNASNSPQTFLKA